MKNFLKNWWHFHVMLVKPYKHYDDNGKYIGKYVMHWPDVFGVNGFNIKFTPVDGIKIEQAVKESIKISDEWGMPVCMNWFNVRVEIPYKTDSDDKTVKAIVDNYLRTFKQMAATSKCVGA